MCPGCQQILPMTTDQQQVDYLLFKYSNSGVAAMTTTMSLYHYCYCQWIISLSDQVPYNNLQNTTVLALIVLSDRHIITCECFTGSKYLTNNFVIIDHQYRGFSSCQDCQKNYLVNAFSTATMIYKTKSSLPKASNESEHCTNMFTASSYCLCQV